MKLSPVHCPKCGQVVESAEFTPNARGGAPRASGYASCLRRCEACGLGFSNAKTGDLSKLTIIYRDPFAGLPDWIQWGWYETWTNSLNISHRQVKKTEFMSSRSEDHVTWTVFKFLQSNGAFRRTMLRVGILPAMIECEPGLILWGVSSLASFPEGKASRKTYRVTIVPARHIG